MEARDYIRPIIAGLVGIGIVVLIIVFLAKLFSGGGSKQAPALDVGKYADTSATATLLIDGPTKLDQEHRQVKITVSQTTNEIDVLQGYEGSVLNTRTYPNNSAAFGAFLQSLKLANFSKGSTAPALKDYRGYCPNGDRYVLTFNDGSSDLFSYWTTSCNQGTFKGNRRTVLLLFRGQIPQKDFAQLTSGASIGF